MSLITPRKIKIYLVIFSCILFNFSSGCGRQFIIFEKSEEQKKEEKQKMLQKRHQAITDELKIIKDKLYEIKRQIYTLTTKEKYKSKMIVEPMEKNEENKEKLAAAKIEAKALQKKYNVLMLELEEIEKTLKIHVIQ